MNQNGDAPGPGSGEPGPEPDPDPRSLANRFVTFTLLFEGTLAVVGWLGGTWSGVAWETLIDPGIRPLAIGLGGGVGLFVTHGLLLYPGGERNPLYRYVFRPFKEFILANLPRFTVEDILLIALMSGLAEEILFRGWLQTKLGIVVASVLFGLIHIWGREGIGYGLYAVGMGFVLGYLFQVTGNLWTPVCAHAVNNFLGLLAFRHGWFPDGS